MTIGYAALSTSLDLSGLIKLGFDVEDFNVYLSRVVVNGTNESDKIEDNKKFSVNTKSGQNTLKYRVKNESTQYDANVSLTCTKKDGSTIELTEDQQVGQILAHSIETREFTFDGEDIVSCTLNITKLERTSKSNSCCNNAKDIVFKPEDPNWKVGTVAEALDYLRNRSKGTVQ